MLDRSGSPYARGGGATLKDQALHRLRAAILNGDIAPGSFVSEAELSTRMQLGKAPIRAALAALSGAGLVAAHPRRGYRIAPIEPGGIEDIFDLRRRLEPGLAETALSDGDRERLERLDDITAAAARSREPAARWTARQAERELLHLLAGASGNALLVRRLTEIWDLCDRAVAHVERHGQARIAIATRTDILMAMAAGRRQEAAGLIADIVTDLGRQVRAALLRMADAHPAALPALSTAAGTGRNRATNGTASPPVREASPGQAVSEDRFGRQ